MPICYNSPHPRGTPPRIPPHPHASFLRKYGRIPYLNGGLFSGHQIERRGKVPIVVALAGSLWKSIPKEFREPIAAGRMLAVSPVPQRVHRVSAETAERRNAWLLDHCAEADFASLDPEGSLARLVAARPGLRYRVLA